MLLIVKAKITENLRACGVCSDNLWFTMERAPSLVKVDRTGNIGRNRPVVLPGLGDAIHLNREQDWYLVFLELAGQRHDRRSSPTMPINDDARLVLLRIGEVALAVGIKPLEN